MAYPSVPADTDPHTYEILVERWRSMSIMERATLVEQLYRDVELLARAGIFAQHPDFTEIEVRYESARRRYGSKLADAAYSSHRTSG